jgi:hypothetical protein
MANISFTSSIMGTCEMVDCCYDDCSGVEGWTAKVWPIELDEECEPVEDEPPFGVDVICDTPCFETEGTCPIDGSTGCLDCLVFATDDPEECEYALYYVVVTMSDNVGNGWEDEWLMVLDTDEIIVVITDMTGEHEPDEDGVVTVYNLCEWFD